MTKQVRTAYRSHRRAAWVVALGLAVAVAAVVVPLATAGEKTYTMTVAPTSLCAPAANGGVSTTVTLKNTGSPQTAGSAEVYFPPNTVHGVSSPWQLRSNTSSSASGGTKDIVALNNMNLAPGQTKTITVSFKSTANFSTAITAALKQANQFNDSSGTANLFAVQGGFPTLRVTQCLTISGRVYHDRNLDFGYFTGNGAFDDSDIAKVGWTVTLYVKSGSTYSVFATTTTAAEGAYSFTGVPGLADYKVCITASSGENSQKWGLQSPSGNQDCGPISTATGGPTKSAGHLLPALSANATGKDFQVVPVVGPFGASDTSTVGGYTVNGAANSTKPDQLYVQDTWVDAQGRTNYRFSPILPCAAPQDCTKKIYLLETLTADIDLDTLNGQQASLFYDDVVPFLDDDLKPMPYCKIDPRQSGGNLATSGVLPGSDTSCIVTGSQTVVAGGEVHAVYQVYTAYDGGRQIGLG
jgi:hypothetical protein